MEDFKETPEEVTEELDENAVKDRAEKMAKLDEMIEEFKKANQKGNSPRRYRGTY